MGKKIRPRKKVQRATATRSRAKTRVLGRRQPQRRRQSAEVSRAVVILNRKQTMGWL